MPRLLLIDDFPRCKRHKCIGEGGSSALKNRCRELLSNPDYRKEHFMFCVISDGDDWQVLHPVLSDLQGGTAHPRREGWLWWGSRGRTKEELRTNHDAFTAQLRRSLALPLENDMVVPEPVPVPSAGDGKPPRAEQAGNKVDRVRKIVRQNFELFREVYKKRYGIDFERSDHVKMFYRNVNDIQAVRDWNKNARTDKVLIDPCAFNEAFLGNIDTPDILILGKNPGAGGIDEPLTEQGLGERFSEMEERAAAARERKFYPLVSEEVMKGLPWFAGRLIFGTKSGPDKWSWGSAEGILSGFIGGSLENACRYADRIASVELVPYHTRNFGKSRRLQRNFGVIEEVTTIVQGAMRRGAVILCPYYGAVELWVRHIPKLAEYDCAFTTHLEFGQDNPEQDGSMRITRLRHFENIHTPRTRDENCELIFDRLRKLGW